MGRGGAQLGKAVKGKSKERRKDAKRATKPGSAGAAGQNAQLSEDMRLLEEYERMSRQSEAQRRRLKQLLQQESYNTRLNRTLVTNLYRSVLRLEKVDQLRREIDVVAQNHARDADRKDALVAMLAGDLVQAEEQMQTAQRGHMQRLGRIVELNSRKIATVESEFERDLKALKQEFLSERAHLTAQHARETREMANILAAVEAEENERIAEQKQAHETEREEIRNKNLEGINELRIHLENKIEDLERQFDDAHSAYVDATAQANDNFKKLKAEDAALSLLIFEKKKKILRLQANLASWRKKLEHNLKECTLRNAQLREQKENMAKHCALLKAKMKRFRASEAKRLTELTVLSRSALQANQSQLAQAERLLQLVELSRKMETEREKVTPFYESTRVSEDGAGKTVKLGKSLGDESESKENATADSSSSSSAAATVSDPSQLPELAALQSSLSSALPTAFGPDGRPISSWFQLERFYKKYNKVLLDSLAIGAEKKRLAAENAQLRAILKQYLDGVAIRSDALDGDNPLLIVNGRINLVEQPLRRGRPRTTQELTHLVQAHSTHQRVQATG